MNDIEELGELLNLVENNPLGEAREAFEVRDEKIWVSFVSTLPAREQEVDIVVLLPPLLANEG
jgi:hypothetical protein